MTFILDEDNTPPAPTSVLDIVVTSEKQLLEIFSSPDNVSEIYSYYCALQYLSHMGFERDEDL